MRLCNQADEDYIPNRGVTRDQLVQEAGCVWNEHGSGAIMRTTIPADWVTSVEYPELDQRTTMFPMFCHLMDDWESVQVALDNRTMTDVDEYMSQAMQMRKDLVDLVHVDGLWKQMNLVRYAFDRTL